MSVHTHPKERQREPLIVVGFKIVEITLKTAIEACYIVAAIGKDFSYYAGVNFSYNKNRVTRFKGDLVKTWTDGVYTNNLSDVTAGYGSGKLCEGHALGEHYLRRLYKGNGRGYRGGAVDVNAGPKDGMIRTQQDFEWVQAMLETGYTFNGVTALSKDQLWYGDLIYADRNGDGNYGDDNDMDFLSLIHISEPTRH